MILMIIPSHSEKNVASGENPEVLNNRKRERV